MVLHLPSASVRSGLVVVAESLHVFVGAFWDCEWPLVPHNLCLWGPSFEAGCRQGTSVLESLFECFYIPENIRRGKINHSEEGHTESKVGDWLPPQGDRIAGSGPSIDRLPSPRAIRRHRSASPAWRSVEGSPPLKKPNSMGIGGLLG